jgi:ATP-binding cassette subfamily C protein
MSDQRARSTRTRDLILFAKSYIADGGVKLAAVLVLEAVLASITGIGLLLILPLLGLLGFGPGGADHPLWQKLGAVLGRLGLALNLETGLALFMAAVSLRALLNWRRETWQVEVEQHFQTALRNRLYETLARTELHWLQRLRTSEFIASTQSEIRRAQQAANSLFQLCSQVLSLGAYFTVALVLSLQMTLFAFVCGAVAVLIMLPLVRRTHALSRQQISVRSSMINNLIEHIQGLRIARSLGLTERFVHDYRKRSGQAARVAVRLTRLSAFSSLAFDLVAVVLLAVVVYLGLSRLEVEPTRFVVLLLVFIRIFPAIGQLQSQMQLFVSHVPSFRHYLDLLSELQQHEEVVPQADAVPRLRMREALELRGVTFRYHTADEPVLRDVSLRIEKGAVTAIGGHSGAGKSTLVDIATGLLPPGSGGVVLDGRLLDERERILWRRETALVPQDSFLFNDTVRANLLCVKPDATERELWEALDAVNCRRFIEGRRGGLDSEVGERGALLSGGERQRLSIARALLRRPQLLVLDEPTNNLDKESVAALLDILGEICRQATLLVVSHDQRILQRADRVFHLEAGTLVAGPAVAARDYERPNSIRSPIR